MSILTVTPSELREILGPVLPWCERDPSAPFALMAVRVFSVGDHTYATTFNGRAGATCRTPVAAPGFDCLIGVEDADRLLQLAAPGSDVQTIEITAGADRLMVAAHHTFTTLTLFDCLTSAPMPNLHLGSVAARLLASENPTAPVLNSTDFRRLAEAITWYARPGEVGAAATVLIADEATVSGACLATHLDRFIAVMPTGKRARVPGTGMTHQRYGARALGPALIERDPLEHWPTILQEVSL